MCVCKQQHAGNHHFMGIPARLSIWQPPWGFSSPMILRNLKDYPLSSQNEHRNNSIMTAQLLIYYFPREKNRNKFHIIIGIPLKISPLPASDAFLLHFYFSPKQFSQVRVDVNPKSLIFPIIWRRLTVIGLKFGSQTVSLGLQNLRLLPWQDSGHSTISS